MSVDIQIVSDLHIEYRNNDIPDPLNYITPTAAILVLAGDIGSFYKIDQLKKFLERLCPYFETVLYIPGNHEYYTIQNCQNVSMIKLLNRLYEIEKSIENLYVLNQSSVIINNVCITGCTLWSNPMINIPKFIVRIHGINNEIYKKKFDNDLKYINKMINYCSERELKLVVITHYCPTYEVLKEFKKIDKYVSLYTTELEDILYKQKVHTWVCGHIHSNFDIITKNGTRVVGNQLGKPKDKINDFLKNKVINI